MVSNLGEWPKRDMSEFSTMIWNDHCWKLFLHSRWSCQRNANFFLNKNLHEQLQEHFILIKWTHQIKSSGLRRLGQLCLTIPKTRSKALTSSTSSGLKFPASLTIFPARTPAGSLRRAANKGPSPVFSMFGLRLITWKVAHHLHNKINITIKSSIFVRGQF